MSRFPDWNALNHLGRAVRGAREAEGISQSELARRAELSPSVISRIESGIVRNPDERTTHRIAAALGRSARVLGFLVSYQTQVAWGELDLPVLREAKEEYDAELASGKEFVDDADIVEKWELPIMNALLDHFVSSTVVDELPAEGLEPDTRWALEQLAMWWPGLTEPRKELVLGYIRDQYFLSASDRKPLSWLKPTAAGVDKTSTMSTTTPNGGVA